MPGELSDQTERLELEIWLMLWDRMFPMKPHAIFALVGSIVAMLAIAVIEELGGTVRAAITVLPLWCYLLVPVIIFTLERRHGLGRAAALAGMSAVLMSAFFYCPWPSRRHFMHDLKKIQIGMNAVEVKSIMQGYHEGTGWPAIYGASGGGGLVNDVSSGKEFQTATNSSGVLALQNSFVYRHDLREADWGIIEIKSNRVTSVSFSPD